MALPEPLHFEDSPWRISCIDINYNEGPLFNPMNPVVPSLVSVQPDGHLIDDLQDPSLKAWFLVRAKIARSGYMMLIYWFVTDGDVYYPVCPRVTWDAIPWKIADTAESWEIRLDIKDKPKILGLMQEAMGNER